MLGVFGGCALVWGVGGAVKEEEGEGEEEEEEEEEEAEARRLWPCQCV